MKQRNLFVIIIVLLLSFTLTNCANNNHNNSNQKEHEMYMANSPVYIDGKIANNLSAFIDSTNAKLPFITTVKALGMEVEMISDEIVHIIYNSDTFILNFSPDIPDIILVKQGNEDDNLMIPPPGTSSYYCNYESADVILDDETLSGVLYLMGISVHVSVDNTNNQVNIITSFENN